MLYACSGHAEPFLQGVSPRLYTACMCLLGSSRDFQHYCLTLFQIFTTLPRQQCRSRLAVGAVLAAKAVIPPPSPALHRRRLQQKAREFKKRRAITKIVFSTSRSCNLPTAPVSDIHATEIHRRKRMARHVDGQSFQVCARRKSCVCRKRNSVPSV